MAEYIGYEKESEFPIFGGEHPKIAVLTDTEIIRCRDCKHYRGKVIVPVCALISFDEERARVQPDGFCAWAERDV